MLTFACEPWLFETPFGVFPEARSAPDAAMTLRFVAQVQFEGYGNVLMTLCLFLVLKALELLVRDHKKT